MHVLFRFVNILLRFMTPKRIVMAGKALAVLGKSLITGGNLLKIGLVVACIAAGVVAIATLLPWWQDFRRELRYIETEIGRTEGKEQQRWIKRKRRLYLSLIPFFHY